MPLAPDLITPDSYYGVRKAFGEALGSHHHDDCGMSFICLHIGRVMPPDDPTFFQPARLRLIFVSGATSPRPSASGDYPPLNSPKTSLR